MNSKTSCKWQQTFNRTIAVALPPCLHHSPLPSRTCMGWWYTKLNEIDSSGEPNMGTFVQSLYRYVQIDTAYPVRSWLSNMISTLETFSPRSAVPTSNAVEVQTFHLPGLGKVGEEFQEIAFVFLLGCLYLSRRRVEWHTKWPTGSWHQRQKWPWNLRPRRSGWILQVECQQSLQTHMVHIATQTPSLISLGKMCQHTTKADCSKPEVLLVSERQMLPERRLNDFSTRWESAKWQNPRDGPCLPGTCMTPGDETSIAFQNFQCMEVQYLNGLDISQPGGKSKLVDCSLKLSPNIPVSSFRALGIAGTYWRIQDTFIRLQCQTLQLRCGLLQQGPIKANISQSLKCPLMQSEIASRMLSECFLSGYKSLV